MITRLFGKVQDSMVNNKLFSYLLKLATDPVPNIRFNVSKAIELIGPKLSTRNKMDIKDVLKKMAQSDPDFDAQYYAQRALEKVNWMCLVIITVALLIIKPQFYF